MAVLLSLSNVMAIAEETVIGKGKATAWSDSDVVSLNSDSSMSPATESIERAILNSTFFNCKSVTGSSSTSGSLNSEIGIQTVTGTEKGKFKAHILWKNALGKYIEAGADTSIADEISVESDPIANPQNYDLYLLSKPSDPRTSLVVREYLGGGTGLTNNCLEHLGVFTESLSINLSAGQLAQASFSVSGIDYNTVTGVPVLNTAGCTSTPFVVKKIIMKKDKVTLNAQDVTITVNNTLNDRTAVTSNGISDKVTTNKSVEISYTIDLEDLTAYTDLKNNTEAELYVELVNGTEEAKIYIPVMSYTAVDKSDDAGVLSLSISASAYPDANGEAMYIATKK